MLVSVGPHDEDFPRDSYVENLSSPLRAITTCAIFTVPFLLKIMTNSNSKVKLEH